VTDDAPPDSGPIASAASRAERERRPADGAAVEVSVVVPFYNPGAQLRPTVERLVAALERSADGSFEILAVSDGSTDGSAASIGDLVGDHVLLRTLASNEGKGEALRVGMGEARGRYVGFIDADGDIPPEAMGDFLALATHGDVDGVLGSKTHPGSAVHSPRLRRLLSGMWNTLVHLLLQLPAGDSQAGVKLFTRRVVDDVLPRTTLRGFAFDLEFLVVAHDLGYDRLVDAPIEISARRSSTVSFGRALGMLVDFARIVWRYRVRGVTRRAGGPR